MDTVTYPDPSVGRALEHFSLLKIDLLAKHPDAREASLGQRVIWAPTMVLADARHRELRRWVGWLPPASFCAELEFTQGMAAFQQGDFDTAKAGFEAVVNEHPEAEIAAEASYWTGIAGFLAGKRDMATLRTWWEKTAAKYPGSRFATHASVIEDAPA